MVVCGWTTVTALAVVGSSQTIVLTEIKDQIILHADNLKLKITSKTHVHFIYVISTTVRIVMLCARS